MDWSKIVTKEVALIAVALIAAVCILVIYGHVNLQDLGIFGSTVIGAVLLAQQKATREQNNRIEQNGNGTLARRDAENKELKDQMVAMAQEHARTVAQLTAKLPPDVSLPKALSEDEAS